ncbi:DinB family protein [Paenibacillus dendritiformis]|uniref:DinB family protein n=1 Tax=Paenibacillus dendritiformis TaxID=130049 RepID=UPI001EE64560|nr:DinB family protein [Paenibacillus dendritiformis]CAH8770870.1 damage-inducible protein DinB [Paenibacillus dendritiformis]
MVRHLAVAERVWLSRLQSKSSAQYSLWEEAEDLTAIRTMFEENVEQYRVYIEGLEESELDEMIDYANQSGVPFRTSVRDILLQVLLHGQYHRGRSTGHFGSNRQSLSKSITSRSRGFNGA